MAAAATRAGEWLGPGARPLSPTADEGAPAPRITYNILLKRIGTAHYAKAGRKIAAAEPQPAAMIEIACGDTVVHGVVDHVYTPPGCDEHCIGTLFLHEV